jgi:DNA-binding NarL/FixJ family response regulator
VIPVVVLSGAENAADHAARLQVAGFVSKPFDPDGLLHTVRAAIPGMTVMEAGHRLGGNLIEHAPVVF